MTRARILVALPLIAFLALSAIFLLRLTDNADRSVVPSALIDRPAPDVIFPSLHSVATGFSPDMLDGRVTLVNVFASWCGPCRVEHPLLMQLSQTPGLRLVGLNYKDRYDDARRFLDDLGDPYDAIGVDDDGRRSIEWGVYGVPESFIVGPDGIVRAKHVGPLDADAMSGAFGDTLRRLLTGSAPAT